MSVISSLYTGVTGLLTYSTSMSVIGNNLANVNTIGFKSARAQFADLLSAFEGGSLVGRGVRLTNVAPSFAQGVFQATGGTTDLSIQGEGLFIVNNPEGNSLYTRDGQFSLNKDGSLVNPSGFVAQGFPLDAQGELVGGLSGVTIGQGQSLLPDDTSQIAVAANLDARTADSGAFPGGFAVGTTDTTENWFDESDFATTVTVFDTLGQAHDLSFLFRRNGIVNGHTQWDYRVLIPDSDINAAATAGELTAVADGSLIFNDDGSLDVETILDADTSTINDINITGLLNGAADIDILAADLSFLGSTQFANESVLNNFTQNGSTAGTLTGITVDTSGVITGQYSNGSVLPLFQLALADFPGIERLAPVGDNLFEQSSSSGDPIIGPPGRGGFGAILPGGLELSTVDVATEFVTMITAQRGFQANSRIITVADQMYDEAVNLKR